MQRKFMGLAVVLCCMALAVALAGCSTPAGRTTGQVVDDGTITTKVKTKLLADSFLTGLSISVETFQGEVTLTGAVNTSAQRDLAARIAQETTGVRKVNNLLKVK